MSTTYKTDAARWRAFETRDPAARGQFYCAVKTTGVYCHPTCAGRPKRENVSFFETQKAAEKAGYRACRRCRPDAPLASVQTIGHATIDTALGSVLVAATKKGLCLIEPVDPQSTAQAQIAARFPKAVIDGKAGVPARWLKAVARAIDTGEGKDLPLDIGGTAFQQKVWRTLRRVPRGRTVSYADLARRVGKPAATRAVASACARNPLAIVVPCHRVVRSDGGLGGYRWGVARKQAILEMEAAA